MLVILARQYNIPLINIVRKEEQVKLLKEMGAEHVLNSSEPDFDKELSKLVKRLNATVCFEAISGTATGQIMKAMPPKSISIVYGLLSEEKI